MKLTVIHPTVCPDILTCARLKEVDIVIWADTFNFQRRSNMHRYQIRSFQGPIWLTIPVTSPENASREIRYYKILDHHRWRQKHATALEINYHNAPFYHYYIDDWLELLRQKVETLETLNFQSFQFILSAFGLSPKIIKSSTLEQESNLSLRLLKWMQHCSADTYLINPEEINLLDPEMSRHSSIEIIPFSSDLKSYHQQHQPFISELSTIDLLLNEGPQGRDYL